jgi:N-acetyl-anhydromuramyl-L-alanine amidase AmpD
MKVTWIGSPNYWAGRTQKVNKIVSHWMAGNLASADRVFQDTNRQTSAHYGIEDEVIHQYVRDEDTAWHARQANPFTIGIEHSAQPGRDASAKTLETSAKLIASLAKKYGIEINSETIVPHNLYVATGRADKAGSGRASPANNTCGQTFSTTATSKQGYRWYSSFTSRCYELARLQREWPVHYR